MTETMRNLKIAAALRQIEALRQQRDAIAESWLERGQEKTAELCGMISEQIIALYEEIDALEDGGTKCEGWGRKPDNDDEIAVTPLDLVRGGRLGWGREEIIRQKQRKRRLARR